MNTHHPRRQSDTALKAVDGDSGRGLRLEFQWRGDRYRHMITAVIGGDLHPLLTSIEGDDHSIWPPSPPLQQLTVEQRPAGGVGLLVGMAGASHWSASTETSGDPPGLSFDIACLVRQRPDRLGSVYRVADGARAAEAGLFLFRLPAGDVRLTIGEATEATPTKVAFDAARGSLTLMPTSLVEASFPRTVRWKYRIELLG